MPRHAGFFRSLICARPDDTVFGYGSYAAKNMSSGLRNVRAGMRAWTFNNCATSSSWFKCAWPTSYMVTSGAEGMSASTFSVNQKTQNVTRLVIDEGSTRRRIVMKIIFAVPVFLLLLSATAVAEQLDLRTQPLVETVLFDKARVRQILIQRIESGVYDDYTADLCIDDLSRCDAEVFRPYKAVKEGRESFPLVVEGAAWKDLPEAVKSEILNDIVYSFWGSPKRDYSPLAVSIHSLAGDYSPLRRLSDKSNERYLQFASPDSLHGGAGKYAYGPNCWYSAISAISGAGSMYAESLNLRAAAWNQPRFLGPIEFRQHMAGFTLVSAPQFGDIIRYYTEDPLVYDSSRYVWAGEVHAAVYIGTENYMNVAGKHATREIALTKNGRSDLDFLVFQDVRGMDADYLEGEKNKLVPDTDRSKVKKGYFRVNQGAQLLDPAVDGKLSDAYSGYLLDTANYIDRWLCLGKFIAPPAGTEKTCTDYPATWKAVKLQPSGPEPTEVRSLHPQKPQGRQQEQMKQRELIQAG